MADCKQKSTDAGVCEVLRQDVGEVVANESRIAIMQAWSIPPDLE